MGWRYAPVWRSATRMYSALVQPLYGALLRYFVSGSPVGAHHGIEDFLAWARYAKAA